MTQVASFPHFGKQAAVIVGQALPPANRLFPGF
jgi:hypothetical protein